MVALLMAVLSFALEFHHHDDGHAHRNCPLCIALHLALAGSLNSRPTVEPVPLLIRESVPLPGSEPVASAPVKVPVIRPPPIE